MAAGFLKETNNNMSNKAKKGQNTETGRGIRFF